VEYISVGLFYIRSIYRKAMLCTRSVWLHYCRPN